jgi:nitrogen fixation/metabolism regulation signal transduction histidine kinase
VVATLHHEINNPLTVIQLSAEKLHELQRYDEPTVANIITHGTRIYTVVSKLNKLDEAVHLRQEEGFEGLIDVARSR